MFKKRILAWAAVPCALAAFSVQYLRADSIGSVEVVNETKHDLSAPVRDYYNQAAPITAPTIMPARVISGRPTAVSIDKTDPAVQDSAVAALPTIPGLNLLGLGVGFVGPQGPFNLMYAPPDTNASVGTTQIVETVNLQYAVFDKTTGTPTLGPVNLSSLFTGFGGGCAGSSLSDPVILFDKLAKRWVFEFFTTSAPYTYCMAVSTSSDATGTYNRYAFASPIFPDYTKVGIWPDAYYLTVRNFGSQGQSYVGPRACAVNRAAMVAGKASTIECFQINSSTLDGLLPADLDGLTKPPAGSPNYMVIQGLPGSNTLQLYKFHSNFINPANATFTGPTLITVSPYNEAPQQSFVPQLGTTTKLDSLGNYVMFRLAYRNFGTYESLLANTTVTIAKPSTHTGVRWYELRSPNSTPVVFQQGTYAPDSSYRWTGSIAQDKVGDIAVGYSVSSSSLHPEIRYTGRVPTDPLGTLEAEATIFNGTGSQTSGLNRWGDYSSMSVDPVDDCTMWYTNEYLATTGSFNWSTRLFSFKFPSCK